MKTISWDDISEEKLNEKITRKMFWGENIMVTRWVLAPHAIVPVHDHGSEQITMVEEGSIVISVSGREASLHGGNMLVIPSSAPHGAVAGPDGCVAIDLFSPIRKDFIKGSMVHGPGSGPDKEAAEEEKDPYAQLQGFLNAKGIDLSLEDLKNVPLDLLARYTYEKECITMGELRKILGLDKAQAKSLLREWKHGDDHSESSYKRSLERIVVLVSDLRPESPK